MTRPSVRCLVVAGVVTVMGLGGSSGTARAQGRVVPACLTGGGQVRTVSATEPCFAGEQRVLRRLPADVDFGGRVVFARAGSGNTGPIEDILYPYRTALGAWALANNNLGCCNTAIGHSALYGASGSNNTAVGHSALAANTADNNTAVGYAALVDNTTGYGNTATGGSALRANTTGSNNTAIGGMALNQNTEGTYNTASGAVALGLNTTGSFNTAHGFSALNANTTGWANTATGYRALYSNVDGQDNSAYGYEALYENTSGYYNTATGAGALYWNTTGAQNTAIGHQALFSNTTGHLNIAIGYRAGRGATNAPDGTTGNYNIWMGNEGTPADGGVIRIGTPGNHTRTWIAGITDVTLSAGSVVGVAGDGLLGKLPTDLLPVGPQGPAGEGLVPGSLLFLVTGTAPAGYTLLGTTKLTLDTGGKKPTTLTVRVYQMQ